MFKKLFLCYLLIASLGFVQLFASTSRFTMLPDPYYYLYESAVDSVIANGGTKELPNIFDNFASSPGTIILFSILKLVIGLDMATLSTFAGVFLAYVVFYLLISLLLRKLCDLSRKFVFFSMASSGFFAFRPIFGYGTDSYLMFILILSILFNALKVERPCRAEVAVLLILVFSMVVKYLPMGLFLLAAFALLLPPLKIAGALKGRIINIALVLSVAVLAYLVYMGFFFYDDLRAFTSAIASGIKMEELLFAQRTVTERLQYDLLYSILYQLSLLRFIILIPIFLFALLTAFEKKLEAVVPRTVLVVNVTGSVLYAAGAFIYVFVSSITDYGARILSLSYAFYVTTVSSALLSIQANRKRALPNKFFRFLHVVIVTSTLLAFVGSFITPVSRTYFELKGLDLTTQYRYGPEALSVSTIINQAWDKSAADGIVATYRYIYLYSRYNSPYIDMKQVNLAIDRHMLIILPVNITNLPDQGFGPLPAELVRKVILCKNVVINSGISVVLL